LLLVRGAPGRAEVLLQLRAAWTHDGGTWALPGGAVDSHEDHEVAALREAWEEAGIAADRVVVKDVYVDDHGTWRYSTVIAHADGDAMAGAANAETEALRWVPLDQVAQHDLHRGLAAAWPILRIRVEGGL
jgi:8-oxo-dGTP pyrophosphatase MutT (NUDIX family)